MKYDIETFHSVENELKKYNQEHWEEASFLATSFPCNPDDETAAMLSDLGVLHFITARHEGRLVGYMSFSVHRHPHSRDVFVAYNERTFVDKSFRKQNVATELLYKAEEFLYNSGVKVVYVGCPDGTGMESLLGNSGYKPTEVIMTKVLGEEQ